MSVSFVEFLHNLAYAQHNSGAKYVTDGFILDISLTPGRKNKINLHYLN